MLLVKDWLLEFVSLPTGATDEEICRRLSLATVEVESVSKIVPDELDHIVVGKIISMEAHMGAARLRVVKVSLGEGEPKTVVCGGSNLAVGMKVALALPGARVRWHGQGDIVELKKTTIRGVESNGMICASAEIGLSGQYPAAEEHEILDLSFLDAHPGAPLSAALVFPTVFEIDNKSLSHRPDLWGHRGIARELSAIFVAPFHDKKLPSLPNGVGHALRVSVQDANACSRYIGVAVDGISVKPSPQWMQERLRASGVRPINAIVDITNYVMLEYGQPMHAFDCDAISEKNSAHIVVRKAAEGETIHALDGNEYALAPDMLIIANDTRPLAIAGVIGGVDSAVSEKTTKIIFEAAHFAPALVRRTAFSLRIATESSRRFEKDLDCELPGQAMARALQLCAKIFPRSRVVSQTRDVGKFGPRMKPIVLTLDDIERRLGFAIPLGRAATILKRLGFGVSARKKELVVAIPSFRRKDIAIQEDLMEELLRFVGYDQSPSVLPRIAVTQVRSDSVRIAARTLSDAFVFRHAFLEIKHYAFVRPAVLRACGFALDDHIVLENPLSDERPYLCRSLLPNLLETIEKNQQQEKRQALFEVNRVFLKESSEPNITSDRSPSVPSQPFYLAFVFSERNYERLFSYCAYMLRTALYECGWPAELLPCDASVPFIVFSSARSADIFVSGERIGRIGSVAPNTLLALGISGDIIACEIDISHLAALPRASLSYREQGAFPAALRDVTFVVDERVAYREIENALNSADALIERVEPFALFRDEKKIGAGKKSVSFHISYRASDRTLTSEEADRAHASVGILLKKKFDANIR